MKLLCLYFYVILLCLHVLKLYLVDMVTIDLQFFHPPLALFDDLLKSPHLLLDPQGFTPTQISLTYSPSGWQSVGGFKIASVGHTSTLLFGGMSNKVCYKQCYHTRLGSGVRQIYQGAKQAESLMMELNCIGWASALMMLVYDFMAKKEQTLGQPDFQIPQMRYVQAGLAVSQSDDKAAFLLEEYIESDAETGGWFIKYLNNNSAKPRTFTNEDRMIRAQFLSFAQHVQFWKTDGLVFILDLQGMLIPFVINCLLHLSNIYQF